jgi:hypothetical protein
MKTRKRLSIGMAGLFLLFIMALWGCASPIEDVSFDGTEKPYSIPGPANVTARVYEGIVLLTWDPVPDAKGYQIIRKDNTDNITKQFTAGKDYEGNTVYSFGKHGSFWFRDSASIENDLLNGHSYTYTVYSLSGLSGNRNIDSESYIGNGFTASNAVTANVPDRRSELPETFAWIKVDQASVVIEKLGNSRLLVTWDAQPNLYYTVNYVYGKTIGDLDKHLFPSINYDYGTTGYSPLSRQASVKLPLLGGENTVVISAYYAGDSDYYYGKTARVSQTETYAGSGVGTPQDFSATRDGATVTFSWDKVDGADSYAIYKAPYNEATGAITGDWTEVITPALTAPPQEFGGSIVASEANVSFETAYYYTVIAIAGTEKSRAATVVPVDTAELDAVGPLGFDLALREPNANNAQKDIQLTWDRIPHDAGVAYDLKRATVEFGGNGVYDEDYNFIPVKYGTWENVTANTPASYEQTKGVVVDTPPAINTYYVYRLIAKKGALSSEPEYKLLAEQGAYIKANPYTLSYDYDIHNPHGLVALKVESSIAYTHGATSIELWKREHNGGNPQTSYRQVSPSPFSPTPTTQYWLDRNVTIGVEYQYRIVAKYTIGTEIFTFVDLDRDAVEIEVSPDTAVINNVSATVTGTTAALRFYGSHLAEAPLAVYFNNESASRTPANAVIEQDPQLSDLAGPPGGADPIYIYRTPFTGLDLGARYDVDIRYGNGSYTSDTFYTAALTLTGYISGGTAHLTLESAQSVNWAGNETITIARQERINNSWSGWTTVTTLDAVTTLDTPFSADGFWKDTDNNPTTVGANPQYRIDTGATSGNPYQYRATVSGAAVEFSHRPTTETGTIY